MTDTAVGPVSGPAARPWVLRAWAWLVDNRARILATGAAAAILIGGLLHLAGAGDLGEQVWRVAVAVLAAELAVEVARSVIVDHSLGVDTIALVAMVGALALGEELAGAVIGLMFSGGAALEAAADRRARRELTALVSRAPRVAQLRVGGELRAVPVEQVQPGDVALVRTGEVIPVDGVVVSERGGGRHEHADRRAAAGDAAPRHGGHERHRQRGRAVRRARRPPGRRQRLRGARAARRAGRAPARAVRAAWRTATRACSCP